MSSIDKRRGKFRIRIRPLDQTEMQLTFSSMEEAEDWLDEHEEEYYANPTPYLKWLQANRKALKEKGIFHVHIPLSHYKNV